MGIQGCGQRPARARPPPAASAALTRGWHQAEEALLQEEAAPFLAPLHLGVQIQSALEFVFTLCCWMETPVNTAGTRRTPFGEVDHENCTGLF